MSLSGSCLCGQINLTISSEPMMAGVCHCKKLSETDRVSILYASGLSALGH